MALPMIGTSLAVLVQPKDKRTNAPVYKLTKLSLSKREVCVVQLLPGVPILKEIYEKNQPSRSQSVY